MREKINHWWISILLRSENKKIIKWNVILSPSICHQPPAYFGWSFDCYDVLLKMRHWKWCLKKYFRGFDDIIVKWYSLHGVKGDINKDNNGKNLRETIRITVFGDDFISWHALDWWFMEISSWIMILFGNMIKFDESNREFVQKFLKFVLLLEGGTVFNEWGLVVKICVFTKFLFI